MKQFLNENLKDSINKYLKLSTPKKELCEIGRILKKYDSKKFNKITKQILNQDIKPVLGDGINKIKSLFVNKNFSEIKKKPNYSLNKESLDKISSTLFERINNTRTADEKTKEVIKSLIVSTISLLSYRIAYSFKFTTKSSLPLLTLTTANLFASHLVNEIILDIEDEINFQQQEDIEKLKSLNDTLTFCYEIKDYLELISNITSSALVLNMIKNHSTNLIAPQSNIFATTSKYMAENAVYNTLIGILTPQKVINKHH